MLSPRDLSLALSTAVHASATSTEPCQLGAAAGARVSEAAGARSTVCRARYRSKPTPPGSLCARETLLPSQGVTHSVSSDMNTCLLHHKETTPSALLPAGPLLRPKGSLTDPPTICRRRRKSRRLFHPDLGQLRQIHDTRCQRVTHAGLNNSEELRVRPIIHG